MKKFLLLLLLSSVFILKAQYYQFSKSTGTYANLSGETVLANDAWFGLDQPIKNPFAFKFWGDLLVDTLYLGGVGDISVTSQGNSEIFFLGDAMLSRGVGKSPISYKVEGTSPNQILKIEYRNVGFIGDYPALVDSANVQCWIYETTNVIEFRYGPNKVKPASWLIGPIVGMTNITMSKFLVLANDPANPTVKKDTTNAPHLNGMPADGTIYRFTPSQFPNGINTSSLKINRSGNKISIPPSMELKSITISNMNGQIVQSAASADAIDLSMLIHGLYLVKFETTDGIIIKKLIL